jgi:hypothetical protein
MAFLKRSGLPEAVFLLLDKPDANPIVVLMTTSGLMVLMGGVAWRQETSCWYWKHLGD